MGHTAKWIKYYLFIRSWEEKLKLWLVIQHWTSDSSIGLIRNPIDLHWNQLELHSNHFKFSYNWILNNHSCTKEKQFLNKSKAQVLLHIWGNHYIWWANKREETIAFTAGTAESVSRIQEQLIKCAKAALACCSPEPVSWYPLFMAWHPSRARCNQNCKLIV